MAQTHTTLLVHVVFSTKNRVDLIRPEDEDVLYAYLNGIGKNHGSPILVAGGTSNHVHLLVSQSKNVALSDLLEHLKKDSSKWIKSRGVCYSQFRWQDGYGAFSIGESALPAVTRYIKSQKQRHARMSFREEYLRLLAKYRVDYDERYVWT